MPSSTVFLPDPKYRLAVRRVEPKWCAKYLGTIHVEDGEDFSIENIRREYGGGKFYVKIKDRKGHYLGHRTLTICGGPMEHGRPVRISSSPESPFSSDGRRSIDDVNTQSERYNTLVALLMALDGALG